MNKNTLKLLKLTGIVSGLMVLGCVTMIVGMWFFEFSISNKSEVKNPFIRENQDEWFLNKPYNKVVYVFIDALGYSWVYQNSSFIPDRKFHPFHYDKIDFFKNLSRDYPENALLYRMNVTPPPSTSIKTKQFMTGVYQPFYYIASPFVFKASEVDTVMLSMKNMGLKSVYFGDYLLNQNFPDQWAVPNLWPDDEKRNHLLDDWYWPQFFETLQSQDFDFVMMHLGNLDRTNHDMGMETEEQGRVMTEINYNLYSMIEQVDDDTLVIIHSDHGAEHYMGEHYTCRQYETCNAFYFVYSKKGFKLKYENVSKIQDPQGVGFSDSSICATFARALGLPIPFSSAGVPLFEILQNQDLKSHKLDVLQTQYMHFRQIGRAVNEYLAQGFRNFDDTDLVRETLQKQGLLNGYIEGLIAEMKIQNKEISDEEFAEQFQKMKEIIDVYNYQLMTIKNYKIWIIYVGYFIALRYILIYNKFILKIWRKSLEFTRTTLLQDIFGGKTHLAPSAELQNFSLPPLIRKFDNLHLIITLFFSIALGGYYSQRIANDQQDQVAMFSWIVRALIVLTATKSLLSNYFLNDNNKGAVTKTILKMLVALIFETIPKYVLFYIKHPQLMNSYLLFPSLAECFTNVWFFFIFPMFALGVLTFKIFRTLHLKNNIWTCWSLNFLSLQFLINFINLLFFYREMQNFENQNNEIRDFHARIAYLLVGTITLNLLFSKSIQGFSTFGKLSVFYLTFLYYFFIVIFRQLAPTVILGFIIVYTYFLLEQSSQDTLRTYVSITTVSILVFYFWTLFGFSAVPDATDVAVAFLGLGPHYFNNIIVSILSLSQLGGFLAFAPYLTCLGSVVSSQADGKYIENVVSGNPPEDYWKDLFKNTIHCLSYFWIMINYTVYVLQFGEFYAIAIRGASWLINYLILLFSFTPSNLILTYLGSYSNFYDGLTSAK